MFVSNIGLYSSGWPLRWRRSSRGQRCSRRRRPAEGVHGQRHCLLGGGLRHVGAVVRAIFGKAFAISERVRVARMATTSSPGSSAPLRPAEQPKAGGTADDEPGPGHDFSRVGGFAKELEKRRWASRRSTRTAEPPGRLAPHPLMTGPPGAPCLPRPHSNL